MNLNEADILMLCPKCGMLLAEELVSPEGMGRECTNCGETNRLIEINVADQVSAIDRIKGAFREHGIEQWTKMFVYGQEYYGETNEVRTVVRVMDWKNRHEPESYYELITKADTGEVVKSVAKIFAQHQGHGSAKRKIPEFPDDWRRVAAYYIWEKEGRSHGRHINHWNRAKPELIRLWRAGALTPFS